MRSGGVVSRSGGVVLIQGSCHMLPVRRVQAQSVLCVRSGSQKVAMICASFGRKVTPSKNRNMTPDRPVHHVPHSTQYPVRSIFFFFFLFPTEGEAVA